MHLAKILCELIAVVTASRLRETVLWQNTEDLTLRFTVQGLPVCAALRGFLGSWLMSICTDSFSLWVLKRLGDDRARVRALISVYMGRKDVQRPQQLEEAQTSSEPPYFHGCRKMCKLSRASSTPC